MMPETMQSELEEERTVLVTEMSPSEGDKRKRMRLDEAVRVVTAALKSGKLVIRRTDEGKEEVVKKAEEIKKKDTKEVTTTPPVRSG